MIVRILLILILPSGCPALAMHPAVMRESNYQTRTAAPKYTPPFKRQQIVTEKNRQMDYFSDLSKLETKINRLINSATNYPDAHKRMVLSIESDGNVTHDDKQALYDTYEQTLYNKFEHTFKKNPAQ